MHNISLRGLDDATLARIRATARRRGVSVNRLIVGTLRQQYAAGSGAFDDLDALAGAWSKAEAAAFASAIAPFAEVEPGLWAGEPLARRHGRAATGSRTRR